MRFASLAIVSLLFAVVASTVFAQQAPQGKQRVYIGTYTGGKSRGIYRSELDLATGKLSEPVLAGETVNPSFLALHPSKQFLFAVSEVATLDGKKSGGVAAFAIDSATGDLQRLNIQPCGGVGPCHVNVDRAGRHVLVACYGGGCAAVLPIGADGKLGEMSSFVQHTGSSMKKNQAAPHAHSINLDASGKFVFVADLGLDKVMIYRYDSATGKLTPNDPPAGLLTAGEGPRHFAFHPSGRWAYVINEMGMSVVGFKYDSTTGSLTPQQSISTLPAGTTDLTGFSTAEVVVHPSGKFLYGSNRGHNTIAAFKIDEKTGQLSFAGHFAEGVRVPRNFNIDPTGTYALVAGQESENVVVFRIDQTTGALVPTGHSIQVGKPVCVKFVQL